MAGKWIPLLGTAKVQDNGAVLFKGGQQTLPNSAPTFNYAVVMRDDLFGGGTISATVRFVETVTPESAMGIILYRHSGNGAFTEAQLGGTDLCSVWTFNPAATQSGGNAWTRNTPDLSTSAGLEPNRDYNLRVRLSGSNVVMTLDEVQVLSTTLPFTLPRGNPGLWLRGPTDILVSDYKVVTVTPKAFVVMQFTAPYDELYQDVIKPVCESMNLNSQRADDTYGPGVIIQDIERQINEARVIIADITPANLNVYYEVGYAHALKKDTVLIAEKPAQLPFDVSPFRVLFYENTIAGKAKVEAGLRKHLEAILSTT